MTTYKKILLSLLLVFILGCENNDTGTEFVRKTSPDGKVDAVIMKVNLHATTPFVYKLFIVQKDAAIDRGDVVMFRLDHPLDLSINWRKNKFLDITYEEARIFSYKSFWQSKQVNNFLYVVEIRLNPPDGFALNEQDRSLINEGRQRNPTK